MGMAALATCAATWAVQLAVRTAVQVLSRDLSDLLRADSAQLDLIQIKREIEGWLPKILVRRWQERAQATICAAIRSPAMKGRCSQNPL